MQKVTRDQLIEKASALLSNGTVSAVLGWGKGEFDYDVTPRVFSSVEELQDGFREFYDGWHSRPPSYQGLLLPHLEGPEIKVWAQRYLRWIPEAQILGGGGVATMSKLLEMMEEVQRLQEKIEARHHSQEALQAEAASPPRTSGRLSSLFPFALLQRHSSKPVLPTRGWKALGDEDDLAKREDEFVDLGDM